MNHLPQIKGAVGPAADIEIQRVVFIIWNRVASLIGEREIGAQDDSSELRLLHQRHGIKGEFRKEYLRVIPDILCFGILSADDAMPCPDLESGFSRNEFHFITASDFVQWSED